MTNLFIKIYIFRTEIFLIFILLLLQHGQATNQTISCEVILSDAWIDETLVTCQMLRTTNIANENYSIENIDSSVQAITFASNKKIRFLPIGVDESFPNLLAYSSEKCALKKVTKKNFKGLKKLKFLNLRFNKIEIIEQNTFEDLPSLEVLWLSMKIEIALNF